MPPTPALADPAAALPGEDALLAAVLADLTADTPKLAYADWLDDHGDAARAAFLRAFVAALRTGDPLPDPGTLSAGWRELTGYNLVAATRANDLADRAAAFLRLARPGFTIATDPPDVGLPTGASKFGGRPDLPAGVHWPADADGPLAFLGQINLADLAASPAARELPRAGLLSVFYDADGYGESRDRWRVLHLSAALSRRDPPADLADDGRFAPCRLRFAEALMLPSLGSHWDQDIGCPDDAAAERYGDQIIRWQEAGHRLLGYPAPIQNDVLETATVRHLLTVASDDNPGWMWADLGLLYYTLAENDLTARRFDRVRCEMQSG